MIDIKCLNIINETLVEKIFDQFKDIKIDDLYDEQSKFIPALDELCVNHKILLREVQLDKTHDRISGGYAPSNVDNFDYEIRIYLPGKTNFTDQDVADYINSLLHEFTHIMILKGILALPPHNKKDWIVSKFTNSIAVHGFDIENITKDNCIKFLNYIFSITERAVFAFSIAYSCHLYRNQETSDLLYNTNKKYILNYENKKITEEAMKNYIDRLQDDKLFLFKIQYAVYFLSDRKWLFKLNSFRNLIKKYEKRFNKMFEKFGG